jgi:hypothetical protein
MERCKRKAAEAFECGNEEEERPREDGAVSSPATTPRQHVFEEQKRQYTEHMRRLKKLVSESVQVLKRLEEEKTLREQLEHQLAEAMTELNALRKERLRKGARKHS